MDRAAALVEIATTTRSGLSETALRSWLHEYLESDDGTLDFLQWLQEHNDISTEQAGLLEGQFLTTLFACPACHGTWLGRELTTGRRLLCPECSSHSLRIGAVGLPGLSCPPSRVGSERRAPVDPAMLPTRIIASDQFGDHPDDDPRDRFAGGFVEITGRWRAIERIGAGGMAEVWKARNDDLGQYAAVKVLVCNDAASRKRFQRQTRIAAALDHPGVVRVRDVGTFDNRPAIILEWVGGGSLQDAINKRERFEPCDAIRIGIEVADALDTAHRLGIVHRDIKPANLLRRRDGRICISDFGLVRTSDTSLTGTGDIVGTLTHMPPEQVTGGTVTSASDVYALAATLFHLLAGKPPYHADSLGVAIAAHPIARFPSIRSRRPDVPEALDSCLREMGSHDPRLRPDAGTVVVRLRALLASLPGG